MQLGLLGPLHEIDEDVEIHRAVTGLSGKRHAPGCMPFHSGMKSRIACRVERLGPIGTTASGLCLVTLRRALFCPETYLPVACRHVKSIWPF